MASNSLTIPRTCRVQQDSLLLQLPAELRNQVYKYVLGGYEVELCFHSSCNACVEAAHEGRSISHYPRSNLGLLEVCHQLYIEARLLPFSANTFIAIPEELADMISKNFSDEQANAIRSVGIQLFNYWLLDDDDPIPDLDRLGRDVRKSLETLKNVRSLKIILQLDEYESMATEQRLGWRWIEWFAKEIAHNTQRDDVKVGVEFVIYDFD